MSLLSRASVRRLVGDKYLKSNRCFLSDSIVKSRWSVPVNDVNTYTKHHSVSRFILSEMPQFGADAAFVCGSTNITKSYQNIYQESFQLAAALSKLGVTSGSLVALFSPNHYHYFTCIYAHSLVGAVTTLVNPLYTEEEVLFQLEFTKTKYVIAHPLCMDRANVVAKKLGVRVISLAENNDNADRSAHVSTLNELIASESIANIDIDSFVGMNKQFDNQSNFILPFSSGTTGKPKGVMITHSNFIWNLLQCMPGEGNSLKRDTVSSSSSKEKCGPQKSCIIPLPFFHIYGTLMAAMANYSGAKTVFMPAFDLVQFLNLVQTHKIQRAHLVPPIILGLAKHPIVDKFDLSSLQCINSAAAPLGSDIQMMTSKRLNCIVKQGWGMTELSPAGCIVPDSVAASTDAIKGSAGLLIPNTEAKIVDPATRQDLKYTQEGEICIRGPQVMKGYFENEAATRDMIDADGWLHTGDVGYFNEEGFMFITDRCKELIKYKGFQVAPAELEAIIASMSGVKDVVVIPVEDAEAGELPRAYVVRQDDAAGQQLTAQDVEDFVRAKVAPSKRLRGGVCFTNIIPKSPSGKILRRVQRDLDRAANAAK